MKKLKLLLSLAIMLVIAIVPLAKAETGTIRIDPVWPIMLESPADFTIWVQGAGDPTSDPNILLAMTEASWNGLTGDVVVSWSGGSVSFDKNTDFTAVTDNSANVPPSGTTEGARYTVASLKDHLSYGLSVPISSTETIYWAMKPFLDGGPLTGTPQPFTVTLPSTDPRMLVYALGKTVGSEIFDNKVPPTIPGFMIPELATIVLAAASFGAFALYAVKRRK